MGVHGVPSRRSPTVGSVLVRQPTSSTGTDLSQVVDEEMRRWEAGLAQDQQPTGQSRQVPHPDPHETGGVPPGWGIRSRYADFLPGSDMVLIHRPPGDWLILRHDRVGQHSRVVMGNATLAGLYDSLARRAEQGTVAGRDMAFHGGLSGWLHRTLMSMFDPTDPTEAAEQMLFGLGGHLHTPPRAAH